jgi:RNA polymerase sigma factor (sigma-70 family)
MPGLNGLELQRKLIQDKIDLPIVFITGHGNVQMAVNAMQAGAVNFLEKPFREQELWDSIRKALELDAQNRRRKARRQRVEERLALLSEGERAVLNLILEGKLNKEIAAELGLSNRTVEDRRARLMKKMGAQSVAELVQLAMTH